MARIMVADDEADLESLVKQRFRRQIREGKYNFVFALNGKEALEKLQEEHDIDVLLCDINMPQMDGLTLLQHLPQVNPLLKAVMVSAYGDMENIRSAMNRGAFDFVCKPVNFDDLELTIEKTLAQVQQAKQTLQAIKENNILRMYVDDSVLNFMNRQEFAQGLLQNETIDATVAFVDICSFTSITETAPANEVVSLLNDYFDVMVKAIIAQGGIVDKFIGDAVMAIFKGDYHLDRAVEACLAVRTEIDKLPAQPSFDFKPQVSIGLFSGEMICGNIGSGTLKRLDYTVIGNVVNTAQRLQSMAAPGQILIDETAYEQIKESFQCNKVGPVKLRNKEQQVVAYEVLK